MIRAQRHLQIIELLRHQPVAAVSDMAGAFGASESTIRRDLDELEKKGAIARAYGCAMLVDRWEGERPFRERQVLHRAEKMAVGRAAAAMVCDDETIFVDGGTTTEFIIPHLQTLHGITVVTCGFNIASLLNEYRIPAILTGGVLDPESQAIVPIHSEDLSQLRGVRVSKAFISAGGISPEFGVTNRLLDRVPTKRKAIEISSMAIIVADGSKVGTVALGFVAAVSDIRGLVTDEGAPPSILDAIRARGVEVTVAPLGS